MARNTLIDVNNHLFEQLERLNDDEILKGENLDREIKRAKAMASIAQTVINNATLALETQKYVDDYKVSSVPEMLKIETKE